MSDDVYCQMQQRASDAPSLGTGHSLVQGIVGYSHGRSVTRLGAPA